MTINTFKVKMVKINIKAVLSS